MPEAKGLMRGTVENNIDPIGLGRIQLRIPALHGHSGEDEKISTASLPWAVPGALNCLSAGMGQFLVPVVGSIVYVMFEDEDPRKPVYFGGVLTTPAGDNAPSSNMSDPGQYVLFELPGGVVKFNSVSGVLTIQYGAAVVHMNKSGQVHWNP